MPVTYEEILPLIEHEGGDVPAAQRWAKRLNDAEGYTDKCRKLVKAFNDAWRFHGVESTPRPSDRHDQCTGLIYCNAGESYARTLLYDLHAGKFIVGNWGDWIEAIERIGLDEAWDKWIESEFEAEIKNHLTDELCDIHDIGTRFRELFNLCCDRADHHPYLDRHRYYVDMDKVAATVTLDDLKAFGITYELWEDV